MSQTKAQLVSPQPFPSWTLNENSFRWEAPTPEPNDEKFYVWDEELYQTDNMQGWVVVV